MIRAAENFWRMARYAPGPALERRAYPDFGSLAPGPRRRAPILPSQDATDLRSPSIPCLSPAAGTGRPGHAPLPMYRVWQTVAASSCRPVPLAGPSCSLHLLLTVALTLAILALAGRTGHAQEALEKARVTTEENPAPAALQPAPAADRLWVLWEHVAPRADCDDETPCTPRRSYTTRLVGSPPLPRLQHTFGLLDRLALLRGQPPEHPQAPRICQDQDAEVLLGFDPEAMSLSEKLDALRGLQGVYFDVHSLKAPIGYTGDFGGFLQAEIERRFRNAGIRVLTEEERMQTPGRPKLNVYFSNTDPVTGCHYSVFASLSQTVLLTRNVLTKLEVGTWAASDGPSSDFPNATESDAILRVIDKFISDFKRANPTAGN